MAEFAEDDAPIVVSHKDLDDIVLEISNDVVIEENPKPLKIDEELKNSVTQHAIAIVESVVDDVTPEKRLLIETNINNLLESEGDVYCYVNPKEFRKLVFSWIGHKEEVEEEAALVEFLNPREREVKEFVEKVSICNYWMDIFKKFGISKKIRFAVIGATGCGKTALLEKLFGLKIRTKKGGVASDTTDVEEHEKEVNGCKIIGVDTPGVFDSRLQDEENIVKILRYFDKNRIHLIVIVMKLDDMADKRHQDMIWCFNYKFGDKIWEHAIVVLTHANMSPPEEYYYEDNKKPDDFDDFDDEPEKKKTKTEAWKAFTENKKKMWKDFFRGFGNPNIPVVLVENNGEDVSHKEGGEYYLRDGTKVWGNLMQTLLETVSVKKAPVLFSLLADDTSNLYAPVGSNKIARPNQFPPGISGNVAKRIPVGPPKPKKSTPKPKKSTPKKKSEKRKTVRISVPPPPTHHVTPAQLPPPVAPVKTKKLKNKQRILNEAANKVADNSNKDKKEKKGWWARNCVLL